MITFAPVQFDPRSLDRYESLFLACFPKSRKFAPTVLNWLYLQNPDGHAIGFDAFEGDELAAHYVCIPALARINGRPEKTLLSLNTATHPRHQGKGLFTRLAEMTYQTAAEQGYCSVYGVANANSTPGFVRKLGFQLVQPLDAMAGLGSLSIDFEVAVRNAQFERVWTRDSLRWRCGNPFNKIAGVRRPGRVAFYANALGPLLTAYAELSGDAWCEYEHGRRVSPLHLFLGLIPANSSHFSGYAAIPKRLRPSPLNMIFRPLTNSASLLEPAHIFFSFLDFDAY